MMARALILLSIGIILKVKHKVEADLNVIPRDTEVMVNDSTYMNCSTMSSLQAWKVHWGRGNDYVYAGNSILEPYNVRFSVEINSSAGTNNLVIRSVQPSDAGQYKCLEDEGYGEQISAQLIVLNDVPVCKSNIPSSGVVGPNTCGIEPDEIKLSCSITYDGNIFPILQWKASTDKQSIKEERLFNFTSNTNEVTYTLTMNSTLDLNNSSFICQTTRTSNRNYSCSSEVIKILYVFSSDVIIKLTMNDELSCFANTSQSCSYKWKWFNGYDWIDLSNGQILKPNEVGRYRCGATCSIGNKSCHVESMYAEVYSTPASIGQNLLVLLVLIALVVISLIGLAIYLRKRNSRNEERRQKQELQLIETPTVVLQHFLDPILIQTIRTKAAEEGNKAIRGLTILDKELFTLSQKSSEVEVYDSMKFGLSRRWNLKELIYPWDIKSCDRNNCLYICNCKLRDQSNEILRVDPNGNLIKNWSIGNYYGWLSVTHDSNIILTSSFRNTLNEYSPDGQLIREINLSSNESITKPWHAIKLTCGHFVVSHGKRGRDLHRVCVVNEDGNLEKSFGGKRGSSIGQMNCPLYLAILDSGFMMVADSGNSRILLLDSDLQFKREILSKENHGLRDPSRILVDQANNRLLVADNFMSCDKKLLTDGRILVFDLK